jgi:hypothetical protein
MTYIIILWYEIGNSAVIDPPEQMSSQNISTLKAYFKIMALDWHMTLTFLKTTNISQHKLPIISFCFTIWQKWQARKLCKIWCLWCYSECISTPDELEKYARPRWESNTTHTEKNTQHQHRKKSQISYSPEQKKIISHYIGIEGTRFCSEISLTRTVLTT